MALAHKSLVSTVRLHTPGANEDAFLHEDKPDADEPMRAVSGTNVQTVGFSQNG